MSAIRPKGTPQTAAVSRKVGGDPAYDHGTGLKFFADRRKGDVHRGGEEGNQGIGQARHQ
jgi:hypothetical protein